MSFFKSKKAKILIKRYYFLVRDFLIVNHYLPKAIFKIEIDITGGFGSQVISFEALRELQKMEYDTFANLRYFDEEYLLSEGITKYSIHPFIQKKISSLKVIKNRKIKLKIVDSSLKFYLGLSSLIANREEIRKDLLSTIDVTKLPKVSKPLLVVHVRRGDFINVADYVMPIPQQLKGLTPAVLQAFKLIFVTDSPVIVHEELQKVPMYTQFKDGSEILGPKELNLDQALVLMISADMLIASNSQLSLLASILNPNMSVIDIEKYIADNNYISVMQKLTKAISAWKN